jgi:hypothetical protein
LNQRADKTLTFKQAIADNQQEGLVMVATATINLESRELLRMFEQCDYSYFEDSAEIADESDEMDSTIDAYLTAA